MSYTLLAIAGVVAAIAVDLFVSRRNVLRRKAFWTAYVIVLFFQLVTNGLLTGIPIVRYDAGAIIGWRVAFAPVEDLLFGFAMIVVTLSTWDWLGAREQRPAGRARPRRRGGPGRPTRAG